MKWRCSKCRFSWEGTMENFHQITMHEKSHQISKTRRKSPTKVNKNNQKLRIKLKKSTRRSGKPVKREGKVDKSKNKRKLTISQKRTATVKKSRY